MICHEERPAPVPLGVIETIRRQEDERSMVDVHQEFKRGEKVQIMAGPLCDQIGLFEAVDDDQRIVILLKLLGRDMKVAVHREDIQAYA